MAAHATVAEVTARLTTARADRDSAKARALTRWEELLVLRQARLDGMAAEIAGALAVGACCPVCGSAEHPTKASPAPGAPDAVAERAAVKALDDAKSVEHLHDELVRDLGTRLALATEAAGAEPLDQLTATTAEAEAQLGLLRAEADAATSAGQALAAAETEARDLDARLTQLRAESTEIRTDLRHRHERLAALEAEIGALLSGTGATSLAELQREHLSRAECARSAGLALDALTVAETALIETSAARDRAACDAGFEDGAAALAAALPDTESAELSAWVRAHEQRLAVVREVLAGPGAAELADTRRPDLDALRSAHAAALDELGAARSAAVRFSQRVTRLTRLHSELTAALTAWAPVRRDLAIVTELSSFVDGRSTDNRLQMRLSAYVLAFRLSQVVAAANVRLAGMSDQRYSLEHTGRRGAGETRGGLSILVRDDWSGESRDPATLSGGETFVVSLALALGLADVVTHEAGGADVDTLFVDEGFGSLDADTLDDVMDTLDALRDGGRVVGVVSHVAEMRDRIPTQLLVSKSRGGSTLALSR